MMPVGNTVRDWIRQVKWLVKSPAFAFLDRAKNITVCSSYLSILMNSSQAPCVDMSGLNPLPTALVRCHGMAS